MTGINIADNNKVPNLYGTWYDTKLICMAQNNDQLSDLDPYM